MIVSRARGFLFVHIPKTGGTAVTRALEAQAPPDDLLIADTPEARRRRPTLRGLRPRGRLWKHATLADIEGVVAPEEFDRLLVWTLVRNPWDRVASYYHWLRAQSFAHPAVARARAGNFAAFLRHPDTLAELAAWPARRYLSDSHGRERRALFVRIERFAEEIGPVEALLGHPLRLPRINASDRPRDWRLLYDAEGADLVGRALAEDAARFGYDFNGISTS
ncbi:sulfotransferase family 2 domain-containing protein [Rubellimicrobium sp. CFH 75288]|uniref:sulfotransferase family 2 domain-containing protein n=1 Tax=Rubellimicrobium sp. CFH 75288 TaxID=2697034 RepID=UPI001412B9B2|nr:sulfotransferase family 2 domain-containing protein [Rubellimicrobium sp. CFH 75288]NAZ36443.1 sulfotransferase family 2 domain-containing protein [Rubellimicrobium sp. CFH 75288]